MKRKYIILTIISVALISAALIYNYWPRQLCTPTEKLRSNIQTGDIIMSIGFSWKSDAVRILGTTDNPHNYSHCGIAEVEGDSIYVIHMSTEKGTITRESISEFIKINTVLGIGVYRPIESIDTARLISKLHELIRQGKEFDNSFKMDDDKEYYCTEMVIKALRDTNHNCFHSLLNIQHVYPVMLTDKKFVREIIVEE